MRTTTAILSLFVFSGVASAQSPDPSKWMCRNLADSGNFLYQGEKLFGSQEACRPIPQTAPGTSGTRTVTITSKDSLADPSSSAHATTTPPTKEAPASIEAPKSDVSSVNSGFPSRWKSMNAGNIRTLRFEGEYMYAVVVLPEAAAKAGTFILTVANKDGDKYTGKTNGRVLKTQSGPICPVSEPIEFTLVTADRIEGRTFTPPVGAALNWGTCSYTQAPDWQSFVWIPAR
jgi:hypothetical protein